MGPMKEISFVTANDTVTNITITAILMTVSFKTSCDKEHLNKLGMYGVSAKVS